VGNHAGSVRNRRRKCFLAIASAAAIAAMIFSGASAVALKAQSAASGPAGAPQTSASLGQAPTTRAPLAQAPPTQTPTAQTPASQVPATQAPETQASATAAAPADDWQKAAGGPQAFDIASVKQNKSGLPPSGDPITSNVPLGPQDMFTPTGGLLSATNSLLSQYMIFAYKLTPNQLESVMTQLPKWATTDRFDIQARVAGNPTKDQFRMMVQALLADRFKLAIHYETKQLPVFGLVLEKPGKLGPQIQRHPDDSPCSSAIPVPGSTPTVAGGFPEYCGAIAGMQASAPGRIRLGARNMAMAMIATSFSIPQLSGADRPIVDRTGLTGKYDWVIEFTPQLNGPLPPGVNFTPDPDGPTFLEALKEQLGLKLEPQTGPVETIVVDHVEEPSEN
jgi:uncharacterized protein (TIGR03435 family)